MVGYVSKDEGKSHHRTHAENVTRAEISSSLAEYRTLQRAVVTEHRTGAGQEELLWPAEALQARELRRDRAVHSAAYHLVHPGWTRHARSVVGRPHRGLWHVSRAIASVHGGDDDA